MGSQLGTLGTKNKITKKGGEEMKKLIEKIQNYTSDWHPETFWIIGPLGGYVILFVVAFALMAC